MLPPGSISFESKALSAYMLYLISSVSTWWSQFAGIFWNHASPPVSELLRLEAHAHSILSRKQIDAGRMQGSEDEEDLCTSVASAMQVHVRQYH
jgi:hypothetical protein